MFDFDGTLVDSMFHFSDSVLRSLNQYNISYPDNIIEIVTPLGYSGTAEYFIRNLGVPSTVEALNEELLQLMFEKYKNEIPLKESVLPFLQALKERKERLFILTASPHNVVDICLQRLGIFDYFEQIWSCDDFKTSKSNPDIYRMAAEKIGVAPNEIAFFDDNLIAVKTAKKAGVYTIGVYDESGKSFARNLQESADQYITSYEQIVLC